MSPLEVPAADAEPGRTPPATAAPPSAIPELRRKRRREWRWAVSAVSCSAPSVSKATTADRSTLGLEVNMKVASGSGLDEAGLLDRAEDLGHRHRRAERLRRRLDRLAGVEQV